MSENQRVREIVDFLKKKNLIRNQQDFCERVQLNKTTMSQIVNDKIKVPNNLFANIEEAFPCISAKWVRTGEGEMLKDADAPSEPAEAKTPSFWQRIIDNLLAQVCQKDEIIAQKDKMIADLRKRIEDIECNE